MPGALYTCQELYIHARALYTCQKLTKHFQPELFDHSVYTVKSSKSLGGVSWEPIKSVNI